MHVSFIWELIGKGWIFDVVFHGVIKSSTTKLHETIEKSILEIHNMKYLHSISFKHLSSWSLKLHNSGEQIRIGKGGGVGEVGRAIEFDGYLSGSTAIALLKTPTLCKDSSSTCSLLHQFCLY